MLMQGLVWVEEEGAVGEGGLGVCGTAVVGSWGRAGGEGGGGGGGGSGQNPIHTSLIRGPEKQILNKELVQNSFAKR